MIKIQTVNKKWYTKMTLKYPDLDEVFKQILKIYTFYNNNVLTLKNKELFFRTAVDMIEKSLKEIEISKWPNSIREYQVHTSTDFITNEPIFAIAFTYTRDPKEDDVIVIKFRL